MSPPQKLEGADRAPTSSKKPILRDPKKARQYRIGRTEKTTEKRREGIREDDIERDALGMPLRSLAVSERGRGEVVIALYEESPGQALRSQFAKAAISEFIELEAAKAEEVARFLVVLAKVPGANSAGVKVFD